MVLDMEYREYKIGELCSIVTDYVSNGSFKSLADNVKYLDSGYARVIRLVDYNSNYKIKDSIWVSEQAYMFLKKSKLSGGEVILTNVGANLGTVFIVPKVNYPITLGPNSVMLKSKENDMYLYYWLISNEGQAKIKSIISGSAMPKFNKTDLKEITIKIPSLESQNKIVNILTSIDSKIELNNKISDNLQKLGGVLIKQEIDKSDNSIIFKDIIKFVKGKKPNNVSKTKEFGYLDYLTIANLKNQEKIYADVEKAVLTKNDILMVMDGASSGDIYYSNYGIVGSTLSKIEITDNKYDPGKIYFMLNYYRKQIKSKNTGSAIPHTDKEYIYKLQISDIDEIKKSTYQNILDCILDINNQSSNLINLRDTLLPKLMNGEINLDKIKI
ncbi:MAG TPA: restriction endonuclease subunit S [Clostridia bacterium]|nr:restriction endonuclease subunit S [Clostridia bacterium]